MASATGPIKVLHFGLGPIGAGVVRQVAQRKGFKIVGAVDIDPAKVGTRPRRGRRPRPAAAGQGRGRHRRRRSRPSKPGRRRALHELVAEEGRAGVRGRAQAEGADRLDDRGAGLSGEEQHALRARRSTRWRRRRRSPCSAPASIPASSMDALPIALTGVCERVDGDSRRSRPGRAHPAAAVPAEDRRRPHARAVPATRSRTAASATSASPNRSR